VRTLGNIAIIALLALIVAEVPGGGNVADGLLAAITIIFLVLIGALGYQLYRQNRLAYLSLAERNRTVLVVALGAIALMIAGADELTDSGLGLLVWLGVLVVAIFSLVRVYQDARSY
jgi:peptidoglycan/LPS O-acetylase OafA/YrhL